jgi:hypothetical protein
MSSRRIFRVFFAVEALRFALWSAFLAWLVSSYDAMQWVGPEASVPSLLAAMWLGFPYGWVSSIALGGWDPFGNGEHAPVRIALFHFLLWLVLTFSIGWLLKKKSRQSP